MTDPIYKVGNGSYVDLSRIIAIDDPQNDGMGVSPEIIIEAQLPEDYVRLCFDRNTSNDELQEAFEKLVTAWKAYKNETQ